MTLTEFLIFSYSLKETHFVSNTRHLVWLYLALFGAAGPLLNVLIYFTDKPPTRDQLVANICNDLSFASVTLCITSIVSVIHDYGTGKVSQAPTRLNNPMSRMLGVISTLLINTTLYVKITSKTLSDEVVTGGYLVSVVVLFFLTLALSYSIMLVFDGHGESR